MTRQRGLFLALGLGALLSLTGREANAGDLTLTVSWTGGSFSFDFTDPIASGDSNTNFLNVADTTALNSNIAASGYQFTGLTANTNNPGDPGGAILRVTGVAFLTGDVAPPSALTITASQTEFTSPSGPGLLASQATANFTRADAGSSQSSNGQLDLQPPTPTLTFLPDVGSDRNAIGATGSAAGYTLSAQVNITLVGASGTSGAGDQFTNNVAFLSVVPEPASLVMMVTGMPLPLVVMGLLRRRRAATA
jgi:hypothetical protein